MLRLLILISALTLGSQAGTTPNGLWAALSEARHAVEAETDVSSGYAYRAYNPAHRYGIRYGAQGVQLRSRDWQFHMQLTAYGQTPAPLEHREVVHENGRVIFRYEGLSEWYVNDPAALEQGFTLFKPAAFDADRPMILSLTLGGNLTPRWKVEGESLAFFNGDDHALDYEKLHAFDALGKALPAKLVLADAKTLQIHVDTKDAAWPVTVDPVFVTQQAKLASFGNGAGERLGCSISMDGEWAVVGMYGDDLLGEESGSVYILRNVSGNSWSFGPKLTADDGAAGDWFGYSVSLSGDTLLVGAYKDDDRGDNSGSVYVFTLDGSTWIQQAKLTAADGNADDWLGKAVSIDGDTALIGAYGDNDTANGAGTAYVFTRSGTTWTQQAKLTAADGAIGDSFGFSVALDSDTALIGAYRDDDGGVSSGSAYLFTRSGSVWTQQAKLVAADGTADDEFGKTLALDGDTAVVSAPL